MNFQQLHYIIAIDRHRHFGQAADSCHVTQATLSAMVKRLEEELGVVLFDRSRKPVKPTAIGETVISKARRIIDAEHNLREAVSENIGVSGRLRVGVIPTVANALLPLVLKPLLVRFPDLQLDISETTTADILTQLRSEHLDMGLLATPISDDDFFYEPLYHEAMMVYGVKEKEKQYMLAKDFKEENVWLLEEGHCFREQAMILCEMKAGSNSLENLTFTGGSFDTLLNLTDRFGGYTMVPELYVDMLPAARRRKTRHFHTPRPMREISAMTYRAEEKRPMVEAVCALIKEVVGPKIPVYKGRKTVLGVEV